MNHKIIDHNQGITRRSFVFNTIALSITGVSGFASGVFVNHIYEASKVPANKIDRAAVRIESTANGDNIYFRGQVYKNVKKGDLIMRAIFIDEGSVIRQLINKTIAMGVPGHYEHIAMYIGNGKILNIGPDDPERAILEMDLKDQIEELPVDHVRIVRMSSNGYLVNQAVNFILFHKLMGEKGKTRFVGVKKEPNKVFLTNPVNIGGTLFNHYYDGFNCASGFMLAYGFAGLNIKTQILNRRTVLGKLSSIINYIVNPSASTITTMFDNIYFTGWQLKQLSEMEIYPQRVK
ncbi:MAG: hypothetical protein ABIH39_04400 [Candidatus Margulisiibacteriota bacterium]